MVDESNFIIRISGRRPNSYYIDYSGAYKVNDIAKVAGIEPSAVKKIYLNNGAFYDEILDVYYFESIETAKKAISEISSSIRSERGKLIFLTTSEIEYIRKALINEGSNTLHIKGEIKDQIFKKLNN